MKDIFFVLLFALVLTGCQAKDINVTQDSIVTPVVNMQDNLNEIQDDLVYHDYGTGIYLTTNSSVTFTQPELGLYGESVAIYVIKLETNDVIKLADYQPNSSDIFTPESNGYYKIIAITSKKDIIDLTSDAMIETTFSTEDGNGYIPLK